MNKYWDKRYQAEGKIWSESPSRTAEYALKIFRKSNIRKILVPGSGYGRNTKLFSEHGFNVTGIEISPIACTISREFDPKTRVYNASVLDMSFLLDKYDSVYCFNTLHLFREADRKILIKQCSKRILSKGILFFTVFSEKETSYKKGTEVEQNTFESKPGRPAHYFSESDLKEHFKNMEIMEIGMIKELENHGEGPHTHFLRYICARKTES